MGVDKNSFPRGELGRYSKIRTKDSPKILSRSRSHRVPTNARNKPQTIPKRKAKLKEAMDLAVLRTPWRTVRDPGADGPRSPSGRSVVTARTVCYPWVDGPLITTERRNKHTETQTVRN
jgi:hypothetical protein